MIEFQLKRRGILFLVSAPSGGGKSTVLRSILANDSSLSYAISATTRKRRPDEQDGVHYHFKTLEEFQSLIDEGAFIEYARVHGNYYGTLYQEVQNRLNEEMDTIIDADVHGSLAIKERMPDTVTIFILPPSIATLEKRLRSRGTDAEDQLTLRLTNAREEVRYASLYDYVIVNSDLNKTITGIQQILEAERRKAHRMVVTDALGEIEFISRDRPLSKTIS
jgi:guanylate kinase